MDEYGRVFMMMDHNSVGRSGRSKVELVVDRIQPPPWGHRFRRFLGRPVDDEESLLLLAWRVIVACMKKFSPRGEA